MSFLTTPIVPMWPETFSHADFYQAVATLPLNAYDPRPAEYCPPSKDSIVGKGPNFRAIQTALKDWQSLSLRMQLRPPDHYQNLNRMHRTPLRDCFSFGGIHAPSPRDAVRLSYEYGKFFHANLLLEGVTITPEIDEEIAAWEKSWLDQLAASPLPEDRDARREFFCRKIRDHNQLHWQTHFKKSLPSTLAAMNDDDLQALYTAAMLIDFLRVDLGKFSAANKTGLLDFIRSGSWRCESVTIASAHLLKLAHVRLSSVFITGHLLLGLPSATGEIILLNNGIELIPWSILPFAPHQIEDADSDGEKKRLKPSVLLAPECVMAAKLVNVSSADFRRETNYGEESRTLQRLHAALELYPELPEAHYWMGRAWLSLSYPEKALKSFQLAVKYGLDNDELRHFMAEAERKLVAHSK